MRCVMNKKINSQITVTNTQIKTQNNAMSIEKLWQMQEDKRAIGSSIKPGNIKISK